MRVAVDAMGGDFAPREVVAGAAMAARAYPRIHRLFLVGHETTIRRELEAFRTLPASLHVIHAEETVGMDESPAQAIRRKKDSSILRAVDLVREGEADAVVSAGNTGAVAVAATLKLGLLPKILRPAIATILPTQKRPFVLIDAGANTDSTAEMLAQFAVMGSVYARIVLERPDPIVGLLSIGEEAAKGNEVTKKAYGILQASGLNFRGNVEGRDLYEGDTDVVVCDGFVGNVVLKTSESAAAVIAHWMKQEFTRTPLRLLGVWLLRHALTTIRQRINPELYGGALLVGVRGICIISHGASSRLAIQHAIRVAVESVVSRLNEQIVEELARLTAAPTGARAP